MFKFLKRMLLLVALLVPWATQAQDCTQTVPYSENFESYSGVAYNATTGRILPTCWNGFSSSTSTSNTYQPTVVAGTGSYVYYHGAKSLAMTGGTNSSYGMNKYVLLPPMNVPLNQLQISFWMCTEQSSATYGTLHVGYVTSDDTTTFVSIASYPSSAATQHSGNGLMSSGVGLEVEQILSQVPATATRIAFKWEHSNSSYHTCCIDDIVVSYPPTCPKVENLSVAPASNEAIVSWTEMGTATNWEIVVSDATGVVASEIVSTNPYTVTDLDANTDYSLTIRAVCGAGDTSIARSTDFRTACAAVATDSLPWVYGFEDASGTGASATFNLCLGRYREGTTSAYPYTSSSQVHSGTYSLYMYGTASAHSWLTLPLFEDNIEDLYLTFWVYKTSANYGHWMVGVMSDPNDITTFDTIASGQANAVSSWEFVEVPLANYAGNGNYLTILCPMGSALCYTYIDDISVGMPPACPSPSDITATNATANSVDLSWTSSASEYIVEYGRQGFTIGTGDSLVVNSNSFTLSGLTMGVSYGVYVTAICGEDTSNVAYGTFTAGCGMLTSDDLPYTEDFEAYGTGATNPINACWAKGTSSSTAYPYPYSTAAITGNRGLYFYGYRPSSATGTLVYSWAALPQLDENLDVSNLMLTFDMKRYSSTTDYYKPCVLYIGIADSVNGFNSAAALDTLVTWIDTADMTNAAASAIESFEVSFDAYEGNGKYVVMYAPIPDLVGTATYAYNYVYVDDVTLRNIPNCFWPSDIFVDQVSSEEATIAWTPDPRTPNPSGWYVEYGPHGFTPGEGDVENVTDTTVTLTDLLPNTEYDVYVSADCGSDVSDPTLLTFTTLCSSFDTLPYAENFDSYSSGWGNTPSCWMFLNQSGSSSTYPMAYTYSSTTYAVSGNCLYFRSSSTTPIYAILPAINADLNTLQLSFTYRNEGTTANNGTLSLGYMTNPYIDTTFVEVATFDQITTLTDVEFPFGAYNIESGNYYIAFKYTGGTTNNYYLGIDNVVVDNIPSCQRSVNLAVDSLSNDFARLTWENYSDYVDSYTVYYSTEPVFSLDTCSSIVANDTVAELTNLPMETDYYWTVVANCGDGDNSVVPDVEHFRTLLDCGDGYTNIVETIGDGTSSSYTYFTYNYTSYAKGYTANIFTAEEMINMGVMTSADLHSISVHAGATACTIPNLKVYAGQIDTNAFTGAVDTALFANLQLLYDDSLTTTANEWATIAFDTTYHYDGISNMILLFRRSGAPTANGTFFYTTTSPVYSTLYGNASSATGNMTATRSYYRTNMIFNMCAEIPSCARPMNVNVASILDTSVTIAWEDLDASYEYVIGPAGFDPDNATAIMTTDTFAVVNGLTQNTGYDFYVRTICGGDLISDWSIATHIITPCAAQQLPYTENFESYGTGSSATISACWYKGTNYTTAYPYPNSTAAYMMNGDRALYFYSYHPSSASTTAIYSYAALPQFAAPVDTLAVSFTMRRYATTSTYYTTRIVVGVMDNPSDINTFTPVDTIDLQAEPAYSDHNVEVFLDSYTGTGKHIALLADIPPLYGTGTYSYNYVYLDDVHVDYIPTCRRIMDISVDNADETTATISWVDPNNAISYDIEYGPQGFALGTGTTYTVYNTTETITGLSASQGYDFYVRANCSATDNGPWSFVTNFRTVCGILNIPFVEDFENYGSGSAFGINPCWTKGTSSTTAYPYPYSTNAINGSRSLYMYGYQPSSASTTPVYSYVALPEFNVGVDSLELSFKVRTYSSASTYYYTYLLVGVMSDPTDISTFVGVDTINLQGAAALSVHDIVVDMSSYTGTGKHITILDPVPPVIGTNTYAYSYAYVDDINVDMVSPCGRPHSLQATTTSNTIALSWVDTVGSTQWQIEYGPTGFAVGTGTVVTVNQNPYTITGLTPSTLYDVYVRSICAGGTVGGNNSGIFTISTSQIPGTIPYYYNFENASEWANWQTVSNNSVNWFRGTAESAEGSYALYVSTDSGATCNSLHTVITNAAAYRDIDFGSTPSSFEMTFLAKSAGINDGNYEGINVMLVDPYLPVEASSTALTSPWGSYNVVHVVRDTNWNPHTILFDSVSGVKRVVFNWYTSSTTSHPVWEGAGAIDSIVIIEQSCVRPTNNTVNDIGPDYVSLHWDGDANANYLVRLREVGTTVNIDNNAATNSLTVSNLTPMTSYYAWVYRVCDTGNISYSAPRIEFTTTCSLIDAVDTLYEDFDSVSGAAYNAEGVLPDCWEGYSNGTNDVYVPHVTNGSTYSYSVTGNAITMTSGSGAAYGNTKIVRLPKFTEPVNTLTMSYWYCTESSTIGTLYVGYLTGFDYENDFVPVATHPASSASNHSGNGPQPSGHGIFDTISFDSVPAEAMFIAFKWYQDGTFYSVCIDNVQVTSSGNYCVAPTALPASNVTYQSATLNWSSSATDFEVAVKAANDATWLAEVTVSNATSYAVSNLLPATQYQFRVRAICDATEGLISDWAEGVFVTDSLPCFDPTNLHTTNLGYTTATLAWNADESQSQWNVQVWNSSTEPVDFAVSGNASYTVTGLAASTQYYAAVKAVCGGGLTESEYSDTISFTTNTCTQVTGVTVNGITAHTAVVSWTPMGVSTYKIEYGDRNFSEGNGTTVVVNNATSYTLTGLVEDYEYTVFVKAVCEEGVEGVWSDQVNFDTPEEGGVSVNTVDGAMNLSIYPNPASNATTIAVSGVNGEVSITIVDMNGRTVAADSMSCEGDCTKRMEVSGLAQGAYFVRVSGEGLNQVRKLVVK